MNAMTHETKAASENKAMSDWLALDQRHCWHPFTQAQTAVAPIHIVRGEGAAVFDATGKRYFDGISSWWVNLHGHSHPVIAEAIAQQAHQLAHVMFAGITHSPAIALAEQLAHSAPSPLQYVFYSDNGSTAIEAALKMTCQYWHNQPSPASKRRRFLALEGGYHGDTFGAMATGKSSGFYVPFDDWLFAVDFLPFPAMWQGQSSADLAESEAHSVQALETYLMEYADETVAFILEPLVQGAAGMRMCRPELVRQWVERVQAHGIPVIFDEVMTGFGRTGTTFAAEQIGVTPDILCLSKGLTGGFLPMGATVVQPHIYNAFLSPSIHHALLHGHSYTANPLGCAAALASLALLQAADTQVNMQRIMATQAAGLAQLSQHPLVVKPRQCGTIMAFDVRFDVEAGSDAASDSMSQQTGYGGSFSQWLREKMMAAGVIVRPLGDTVYVLPPYCTADVDLQHTYDTLWRLLDEWHTGHTIHHETSWF
jgi:adenosylmethionine-8-amino-7-oxononanoate aminotransferase